MNKDFLCSELIRIGQDKLISISELEIAFDKIMNGEFNSGDSFRIDIKGSNLWIEKI